MTEVPQRLGADSKIAAVVRMRAILVVAALLLPLALYGLFERQARRLDALAAHGEPVEARVTTLSGNGGTTHYTYRVAGADYTWNVARADAPFGVGEVFPATYLPEDPALSRPYADRGLASSEAARARSFAWKACSVVAGFLLAFAGLAHHNLRRLRAGAPSELTDPEAYKRRLRWTALALLPLLLLVSAAHFQDATAKGQSTAPVFIGLALTLGIAGGTAYFLSREGPQKAKERAARLLRWIAPAVAGISLLRLLALLFGR